MRRTFPIPLLLLLAACSSSPKPSVEEGLTGTLEGERPSFEEVLPRAQGGDTDYQLELAMMYHDGDGTPQDYGQALNWYAKAAEAGNRMAQFNLGLIYKNGEGIDVNMDAARMWFARASEAGDVRATHQLGLMAYSGYGLEKDFAKAREYFTAAAQATFAESQLNLGVMHIRGEGATQNLVDGYAWLKIAEEGGNTRATELLDALLPKLTPDQKAEGEKRIVELKKEVKTEVR